MKTPSKTPGSPPDFGGLSRLNNMKTGDFLLVAKMQRGTFLLVTRMRWGTFFAQTGNFAGEVGWSAGGSGVGGGRGADTWIPAFAGTTEGGGNEDGGGERRKGAGMAGEASV